MAMIMYCWHALKLEGVYRAVAYLCVDKIRYNTKEDEIVGACSTHGSDG
jgi:hypothetical protein